MRDYSSQAGRYLENDPLGTKAGLNLYWYANATPMRVVDPTGLVGLSPGGNDGTGLCTVVCGPRDYEAKYDCLRQPDIDCGVKECVEIHEQSHIEDFRRVGGWAWWECLWIRPYQVAFSGSGATEGAANSERKAYEKSSACFAKKTEEEKKKDCPDCLGVLERWRKWSDQNR